MRANPFLKFSIYKIVFCFVRWKSKFDLFQNVISTENIIYNKSARKKAKKCLGIPNCLSINNTLYKTCCQHAGVPLTECKK